MTCCNKVQIPAIGNWPMDRIQNWEFPHFLLKLHVGLLWQLSWNTAAALSTSSLVPRPLGEGGGTGDETNSTSCLTVLSFIFLTHFGLLIHCSRTLAVDTPPHTWKPSTSATTNLKPLFQEGQCFLHLSTVTMEISPGANWLSLHCTLCIAQQPLENRREAVESFS